MVIVDPLPDEEEVYRSLDKMLALFSHYNSGGGGRGIEGVGRVYNVENRVRFTRLGTPDLSNLLPVDLREFLLKHKISHEVRAGVPSGDVSLSLKLPGLMMVLKLRSQVSSKKANS